MHFFAILDTHQYINQITVKNNDLFVGFVDIFCHFLVKNVRALDTNKNS